MNKSVKKQLADLETTVSKLKEENRQLNKLVNKAKVSIVSTVPSTVEEGQSWIMQFESEGQLTMIGLGSIITNPQKSYELQFFIDGEVKKLKF